MKFISLIVLFAGLLALAGCGKDAPVASVPGQVVGPGPRPGNNLSQLPLPPVEPAQVAVAGVTATITTTGSDSQPNRQVPAKTFALSDFTRTIEKTGLTATIQIAAKAAEDGTVQASLLQAGKEVANASSDTKAGKAAQLSLNFKSPKLSNDERAKGFGTVSAEIALTMPDGKTSRLPFSYANYDESQPTFVQPRSQECLIYDVPERASGCYQNRWRTTQEIDFNDSVTQHHEVDVQLSGGLQLAVAIVTLNFGLQTTVATGTDVSRGSEIHFTNCIECATVIYRQTVESVRKGDVYQVQADGSLAWKGDATVRSKQVAYEFASTGSESQNYSCDIPSQLPIGQSPECKNLLGDGTPQ
jgi:hypothetical protein